VLEPDTFLTSANLQSILGSQAVLVVVTLGLLFPLSAGDYDLSVASTLTLAAMIVALLNARHGWPVAPAILVALAAGLLVGAVNGALVTLLELESLVVTLGSGTFVSGVTLGISDSNTIGGISDGLVDPVIVWDLLGIPLSFFYALVLCAVVWLVFDHAPAGRRLLFTGRGRDVARLSGVRIRHVRFGALVTSGGIAALAGVLYAGTTGSADPSSGATFLLPAFAAAFLGATSIAPGRFNAWGALIAAYFLATGVTGLQLIGVESFVQDLFYGAALIVAIALPRLVRAIGRGEARAG
jgi:ribose transport system permease protein